MLRRREGALDRVPLVIAEDSARLEADPVPAQRVEFSASRPRPLE
jgi:hypothetical protein